MSQSFCFNYPTRKLPLVHQLSTMSSTPPSTTTFPASSLMLGVTRLHKMLRQVYHSKLVVLQYNNGKRGLSMWTWCVFTVYIATYKAPSHFLFFVPRPLDGSGQRVSPTDLGNYCESHEILRPYCLCTFNDASKSYPQASFCKATSGVHVTEIVVQCAGSEDHHPYCGYLGRHFQLSLCRIIYILSFYFYHSATPTYIYTVHWESCY